MKKLFLILPTVLLIAAPIAAQAREDKDSDQLPNSHANIRAVEQVKLNEEREDDRFEDRDENEDELGESNTHQATVGAQIKENHPGLKVSLKIKNQDNPATGTATPSASLKVSGPVDQVIQVLEQILSFLKGLI